VVPYEPAPHLLSLPCPIAPASISRFAASTGGLAPKGSAIGGAARPPEIRDWHQQRGCHGLLAEHVLARFETPNGKLGVT
jgi:hypothetical protein